MAGKSEDINYTAVLVAVLLVSVLCYVWCSQVEKFIVPTPAQIPQFSGTFRKPIVFW